MKKQQQQQKKKPSPRPRPTNELTDDERIEVDCAVQDWNDGFYDKLALFIRHRGALAAAVRYANKERASDEMCRVREALWAAGVCDETVEAVEAAIHAAA